MNVWVWVSWEKQWSTRKHDNTHSHGGEKSNKCKQCDNASSQPGNLRTHLKTHIGEKSNKQTQTEIMLHNECLRCLRKTLINMKISTLNYSFREILMWFPINHKVYVSWESWQCSSKLQQLLANCHIASPLLGQLTLAPTSCQLPHCCKFGRNVRNLISDLHTLRRCMFPGTVDTCSNFLPIATFPFPLCILDFKCSFLCNA